MDQICGTGYRKALEFLIKDYAIKKYPAHKKEIIKKFLGNVINDHIDDVRIKDVAARAAWLGNDETHYERKWLGADISDLKALIDLTLHWIESESITEDYKKRMPKSTK